MTSSHANPETKNDKMLLQTVANEWGQITGLEANAEYIVVRRPTRAYTETKAKEVSEQLKGFLQTGRDLTEAQIKEIDTRYGTPARAKAAEIREVVEKRVDMITKELESRVEKIEAELGTRADKLLTYGKAIARPTANGEMPENLGESAGEVPTGEPTNNAGNVSAKPKKNSNKKTE